MADIVSCTSGVPSVLYPCFGWMNRMEYFGWMYKMPCFGWMYTMPCLDKQDAILWLGMYKMPCFGWMYTMPCFGWMNRMEYFGWMYKMPCFGWMYTMPCFRSMLPYIVGWMYRSCSRVGCTERFTGSPTRMVHLRVPKRPLARRLEGLRPS